MHVSWGNNIQSKTRKDLAWKTFTDKRLDGAVGSASD